VSRSALPAVFWRRQDRLARIRKARKQLDADTAVATARQRQQEAKEARARVDHIPDFGGCTAMGRSPWLRLMY
jgi:hypothetical protein